MSKPEVRAARGRTHLTPIATIHLEKLAKLRDEIARNLEGKARRREILRRAEQMEFAWEKTCLDVTPLRARR